ncbi:HlyD family type I secretion periplasmic adaptor subunit [uncultured Campylobacter sp.]|jgi:type I secretion membrane fusion protein, hlyD family|uniref:HlyD family type I secretion periplasmic adaptor subunit n=1 Tax=uncultured Campylobacter sp. TaxID=218934 RepID=UPI0025EB7709|nr:HlyD family type I secretion periplasmic adaptor subunit [uncultured Campylobacter sp.]
MILKSEKGTVNFGIFVIFMLVGVFGIWLGMAPLNSAAVAVGKINVVSNKKIIQHLEGGVVDKIFVKDGDVVKAGDPLVEIKNAALQSEIGIVRADYLRTSAIVSRLEAQKDDANEIKFSDDIKQISGYEEVANGQISIFNEQKKLLDNEKTILKQRIKQLENQIQGAKAIMSAKKDRIASLNEEIREWERLFKEQLADKVRLRDLNREKTAVEGELAAGTAEIARLGVQINETQGQIALRDRSFKEDILKKLEDAKIRLVDLEQRYNALKDQSERTIVKSPVEGSVVELAFHTIGGVIRPGERIMSIVPDDTDYVVEAKLNVVDIDTVHVGQLADIRFSAFQHKPSFVMEGKVTYVSADSVQDNAGHSYYDIKAELTPEGMKEFDRNEFFIVPGMPVEVMIKTGDRTMLEYVLKPFIDMFKRAFNED